MADRLVVGLAALALLSGGLILIGKGLGGDKNAAGASGLPGSSSAVSSGGSAAATPTLQPTPRTVAVESRPLPSPEPPGKSLFQGWIRLEMDLPIYADVSTSANRIGALPKGALAFAEDAPIPSRQAGIYWLQIDNPSPIGFIAAGNRTTLFVKRFVQPPTPTAGYVSGVAAGPDGFVAFGVLPGRSDETSPRQYLATSADGQSWQLAETTAFQGSLVQSVAWGSAGWLAVSDVALNQVQSRPWLWTSVDGRSWRSLGSFTIQSHSARRPPTRLLGSGSGYLLTPDGSDGSAVAVWHSTDGRTWTESRLPRDLTVGPETLIRTGSGYYAWPDPSAGARPGPAVYSADGQNWISVPPPPTGPNGRVVPVADGLLAVDSSPVTGSPRVWTGSFSNGSVAWTAEEASLPPGAGIASLASSGRMAMLFGWDRATDEPMAWSGTGANWSTVTLPRGAFGGAVPTVSVGGPQGFVAVGSNMTLRADNPVLWSGTAVGDWRPEASPVVPQVADQARAGCPPKPADALTFVLLDRPTATTCYASTPITFRAFDVVCGDCSGQSSDVYQPDWLANPSSSQLFLSPLRTLDQWWVVVRRSASLLADPTWANHWIEVTGHFDDPSARSCRWIPDPHGQGTLYSAEAVVNTCRQEFVVTRIELVSGP